MKQFPLNTTIRTSVEYKQATVYVDPPTPITCKLEKPDGTETTATVVKDAVGRYHALIEGNVAGRWIRRWTCGASPNAPDEAEFEIVASALTTP